jgi:hypothetical protein
MSRNSLYLVVALLAAGCAVLGYIYYQDHRATSTIKIDIGKAGVSIESN